MNQMEAFHILASADRQLVLHELLERNEKVCIKELSKQVAARRHRISPEKISDTEIEHAHVRLVHAHLPMLQDINIIEANWRTEEISLGHEAAVTELLDAAEELESWPPNDLLDHPPQSK